MNGSITQPTNRNESDKPKPKGYVAKFLVRTLSEIHLKYLRFWVEM